MSIRKEILAEGVEVYLGDCLDILPTLSRVDAVVTDPPYGIGVDVAMAKKGGKQYGQSAAPAGYYRMTNWDNKPISKNACDLLIKISKYQIIFGGNYFELPPTRCWLVWDKVNGTSEFADCELAWTNLDKPVRKITWMWNGMLRVGKEKREGHPTQKPLEVMKWCIDLLPPDTKTILDPYCGSGTTGIAAVNCGKKFIGIERDEEWFDLSCKRISQALKQPALFTDKPESTQSGGLF